MAESHESLDIVKAAELRPERLVVTQANDLVRAAQVMTLLEKRLISLVIAHIRKGDIEFMTYRIPVYHVKRLLGQNDKAFYERLKELRDKLLSRIVTVETQKGSFRSFNWISVFEYVTSEESETGYSYIDIRLHDHLRPLLLELRKHFQSIPLLQLINLPSINSVRIFEILIHDSHKLSINSLTYDVEDLKFRLGLENKYPAYKDFRVNVLDRAQEDCLEHTEIMFTYEPIKTGRRITHIMFNLKSNIRRATFTSDDEPNIPIEAVPDSVKIPLEQLAMESAMRDMGFTQDVRKIIETHGLERVKELIAAGKRAEARAMNTRNPVRNLPGLIMYMLKNNLSFEQQPNLADDRLTQDEIRRAADNLLAAFSAARAQYAKQAYEALDSESRDAIHDFITVNASQFILKQLDQADWQGLIFEREMQKAMEAYSYLNFPPELRDVPSFVRSESVLQDYDEKKQAIIIEYAVELEEKS